MLHSAQRPAAGPPNRARRHAARPCPVHAPRLPRLVACHFFREDRATAIGADAAAASAPGVEAVAKSLHTRDGASGGDTQLHTPTDQPAVPAPAPTAPAAATTSDAQPPGFERRRLLVFSGLVLGYAGYYLTRNSLTYTAPVMVSDPALGFTLAQVGAMTSIFPIAYGMSKFVSGIVGDRFSPALLLGGGLLATASCNIALGAGNGLTWFAVAWALNGLMQGVGAPSCARMLTSWFAARERGTYWGLWNVAHNTGGFLAPLVAASAAHAFGWRWGMWAPGLTAAALGAYVLLACRDSPAAAGFNPVEPGQAARSAPASSASTAAASAAAPDGRDRSAAPDGERASGGATTSGAAPGLLRAAVDNVLSNGYVWALAAVYFCIYVVRQGITSWSVFYLLETGAAADAAQAAVRVSGLELGGLVGGLAAGRVSDALIRRKAHTGAAQTGDVGTRVRVVMAYTAALAGALALFRSLPPSAPPPVQWLSVAAIGFCIYGPQMLIGLCGAECVHPASVGASQGVLGWVAYLGAANAGVPLSYIITRYGWTAFFASLTAACGLALLLLAPCAGLQSYAQRQQREQQEQQGGLRPKLA